MVRMLAERSERFLRPEVEFFKPEVGKYIFGKLVKNCLESPIRRHDIVPLDGGRGL